MAIVTEDTKWKLTSQRPDVGSKADQIKSNVKEIMALLTQPTRVIRFCGGLVVRIWFFLLASINCAGCT